MYIISLFPNSVFIMNPYKKKYFHYVSSLHCTGSMECLNAFHRQKELTRWNIFCTLYVKHFRRNFRSFNKTIMIVDCGLCVCVICSSLQTQNCIISLFGKFWNKNPVFLSFLCAHDVIIKTNLIWMQITLSSFLYVNHLMYTTKKWNANCEFERKNYNFFFFIFFFFVWNLHNLQIYKCECVHSMWITWSEMSRQVRCKLKTIIEKMNRQCHRVLSSNWMCRWCISTTDNWHMTHSINICRHFELTIQ